MENGARTMDGDHRCIACPTPENLRCAGLDVRRFCELIDPACTQFNPGYRDVIVQEARRGEAEQNGRLGLNPRPVSVRSSIGGGGAVAPPADCCGGAIPSGIYAASDSETNESSAGTRGVDPLVTEATSLASGAPSAAGPQITSNHPNNEPGIASVAAEEPPGFESQPKHPFQATLLHPTWSAANAAGGKIEGVRNLNNHRHREILEVPGDPALSLGLPERDEENVSPRRANALEERRLLRWRRFAKRRLLGAGDLQSGIPLLKPSSGFQSDIVGATQKEQPISPSRREGAQLEDQI